MEIKANKINEQKKKNDVSIFFIITGDDRTKKKHQSMNTTTNPDGVVSQHRPHFLSRSPIPRGTDVSKQECTVLNLLSLNTEREESKESLDVRDADSPLDKNTTPTALLLEAPLKLSFSQSIVSNWQSRLFAQEEYNMLLQQSYLHTKQIVHYKIKKKDFDRQPIYPIRVMYLNGEAAHFPSHSWEWVHRMRSRTKPEEILYGKDIAYSKEGIRLIVPLRFSTRPSNIITIAKIIQKVVGAYFQNQTELFGFWLLSNDITYLLPRSPGVGYDLVFKDLVVNCQQAQQIISSVCYALERRLGILGRVKCKYGQNAVSQRPIFTCRRQQCPNCRAGSQTDPSNITVCGQCLGHRSTFGDIYAPHTFFNSRCDAVYTHNKRNLPDRFTLFQETAVAPMGVYTEGYALPVGEAPYVDQRFISSHQEDVHRDYVFKQDRKILNQRYSKFTQIESKDTQKLLKKIINGFAIHYRRLTISRVYYSKSVFVVCVNGQNRSYCNVISGVHEKNRVYFEVNTVRKTVYQCCFHENCQQLFKNKEKKAVYSQVIGDHLVTKLTTLFHKEYK